MDGNKDECEKCIQIALKYLRSGDREKALKFLHKAHRLYPCDKAKHLIDSIQSMNGSAASGEDENAGASGSTEGTHGTHARYRGATAAGAEDSDSMRQPKYTGDQLTLVKKIQKCKDYYEILGVSKDSTDDDVKKAYRKLALKLHPDKNHAPGATEAFKAVGKAFSCLSDTEKRKRYDLYGSEAERAGSSGHSHRHGARNEHYSNGFYYYEDDDISAEEIFNMFFGGGFPQGHMARRRQQANYHRTHHTHSSQPDGGFQFLMHIAPLLFMVIVSLLSMFLSSDPTYSLDRDYKYNYERITQNLGVPYYVKSDFSNEYKGSIRKLEQNVEEEYTSTLRSNCYRERSYKENMLWRARSFGDGKMYEKAQNLQTPACDKLTRIYGG